MGIAGFDIQIGRISGGVRQVVQHRVFPDAQGCLGGDGGF